jgi:GNAT superfamily N-acetyltransferase
MMENRHLLDQDLEAAFKINVEYLSASRNEFLQWYKDNADLFVGIFDKTVLVGICYGRNWNRQRGYVLLEGIATIHAYRRSGAGSLLLQFFEEQVKKRETQWITVGVAPDLKTEIFYLKNGCRPTRLCARLKQCDLPRHYERLGYQFCEVRQNGDEVALYIETAVRDRQLQAKLKEDLGANEVIFIMEKEMRSIKKA